VKAENAAALKYIFQDEIYLLPNEKSIERPAVAQAAETAVTEPAPRPVNVPAQAMPGTEPTPAAQPGPVVQASVTAFNYLGANKKSFLIITHYPGLDFIADEHLTALQSILKRKGFELDDVAIFNIDKAEVNNWDDLLKYFRPEKVLVLGKNAIPAKLEPLPLNQLKQLPDYALLYSFNFEEMMTNIDNKKAFWDQMKNL
jgi:hypothetical protein